MTSNKTLAFYSILLFGTPLILLIPTKFTQAAPVPLNQNLSIPFCFIKRENNELLNLERICGASAETNNSADNFSANSNTNQQNKAPSFQSEVPNKRKPVGNLWEG